VADNDAVADDLPLSAAETYSQLRVALDPVFQQRGLGEVRNVDFPAWSIDSDGGRLFVSVQVDRKATDPYAGGAFRIEWEKSMGQIPGRGLSGRALFFQLLVPDAIEAMLKHQNSVIGSLSFPPTEQIGLYPDGAVRQQYLKYFEPQDGFDAVRSWLRFRTRNDLDAWVLVLAPTIGPMMQAASQLDSETLYLGKGSLVSD
jgi:hypothetical protein